jgi:hypothetical protein
VHLSFTRANWRRPQTAHSAWARVRDGRTNAPHQLQHLWRHHGASPTARTVLQSIQVIAGCGDSCNRRVENCKTVFAYEDPEEADAGGRTMSRERGRGWLAPACRRDVWFDRRGESVAGSAICRPTGDRGRGGAQEPSMRPTGLEPVTCGLEDRCPPGASSETAKTSESKADCLGRALGALVAELAPSAPDLADLITAWPTLPEPLKAGIAAMVKAASGQAEGNR